MIFAGTLLTASPLTAATQTVITQTAATDRAVPGTTPAVQLSFRVDRAIAGVERGQVLTIHEWAGAWSMHRPMSRGQHILIFLYPPSRLGFTSPEGGSLGQVALDPSGKNVSEYEQKAKAPTAPRGPPFVPNFGSQTSAPQSAPEVLFAVPEGISNGVSNGMSNNEPAVDSHPSACPESSADDAPGDRLGSAPPSPAGSENAVSPPCASSKPAEATARKKARVENDVVPAKAPRPCGHPTEPCVKQLAS
jgi:hypothetical protein